jgi:hypothetical protein
VIQLTLYPYRDSLDFVFEHPLNSEPLRIDVVIIKKKQGTVIDHPIGAILREINVVEYKSPGDHLSVDDFHKVGAYARLYSVQNGAGVKTMSVSFVTTAHPRKLFEHLKNELGFTAQEREAGIYYIEGDIFPIQIIESKRLVGEGGLWLKDLRKGLNGKEIQRIMETSANMPKGAPVSAYLHTVLQANGPGFKEMVAMADATFEAVLEEYGFTEKWKTEGLEQGLERGREDAVLRLQ